MTLLTAEKLDGLALAALLADDRALEKAADGLGAAYVDALRGRLSAQASLPRAQVVTGLLERVRPALSSLPSSLPPRIVAALAPWIPQQVLRTYAGEPVDLRAGFRLIPELVPVLLRLSRAEARAHSENA